MLSVFAMTVVLGCSGGAPTAPDSSPPNPTSPGSTSSSVESIALTPSEPEILVGESVKLEATPLDENGDPISADVEWRSLDEAVATVDGSGLVQGEADGTADIVATSGGISDTAAVGVQSSQSPEPDSDDRILFDTRAGGAQSLQAMTTEAEVESVFMAPSPHPDDGWEFTTDFDGDGTHAIVLNWRGVGSDFGDRSRNILVNLPTPKPSRVYVHFKMWHGRTATSVSRGEGVGEQGAFDFTNENDPVGNAGAKRWRILGDKPDGSLGGFDLLYHGPAPVSVGFGSGSSIFSGGTDFGVRQGELSGLASFVPEDHLNEVVSVTILADIDNGVARAWIDGELRLEDTNMDFRSTQWTRFQLPMIIRSPQIDMTEYFWDIVSWEPR
jgi:hypothetical protein